MTCYPVIMAEYSPLPAADRIDRALTRIEDALAARAENERALAGRHVVLRQRVSEAIDKLDDIIASGGD